MVYQLYLQKYFLLIILTLLVITGLLTYTISKEKALDFDDLLLETVRLFREKPEICAKWQKTFKHILVDEYQDTNVDTLTVGNDKALAFGNIWQKTPIATATNNLEIKKNQDSGECNQADCCQVDGLPCTDCCVKVNIDQINVGNREAMAFGFASATNNVKIVANQQ
jgi:hypothetical protein